MRSIIWALLAGLATVGCDEDRTSRVASDSADVAPIEAPATRPPPFDMDGDDRDASTRADSAAIEDAAPGGSIDAIADMPDRAPPPDRGVDLPDPEPDPACFPLVELDALRPARYQEHVEWVRSGRGTQNQVIVPEDITRVLFLGDEALRDVPNADEAGGNAHFATIRGRLTKVLARLLGLTAPDESQYEEGDWYRPDRRGELDVVGQAEADFAVCAHDGAGWSALRHAIDEDDPDGMGVDGVSGLRQGCLHSITGDPDGTLLVVVVFGGYDPDAYARDRQRVLDEPEPAQPYALGRFASETLLALRAMFRRPRDRAEFADVVVLTTDLISWRAGASRCGACEVSADDEGFSATLTAFNEALVDHSSQGAYEVLLADARGRVAGATCLDAARERDNPVCNTLPDHHLLKEGRRLDTAPWEACCWTAGHACNLPDRDGHLVIASAFIEFLDELSMAPADDRVP